MRHINEPPPSVRERRPELSPRLDAVVKRAMAKDPRERFGSMDELCTELAACVGPETAMPLTLVWITGPVVGLGLGFQLVALPLEASIAARPSRGWPPIELKKPPT